MNGIVWLKVVIIGLPLLGALLIGLWRGGAPRWAGAAAAAILLIGGVAALALFAGTRQYACMIRPGPKNCFLDGLATLLVCFLGVVLARAAHSLHGEDRRADYVLLLLLFAGWAAFGLADNLLQLLIGINVCLYALFRLLRQHDIRWGFFVPWRERDPDRR